MNVRLNRFNRMYITVIIFFSIITGFIFYILVPLPKNVSIPGEYPTEFYIAETNCFEFQPPNQCAAYATAYVLRHFGMEGTGENIYKRLPFKIPISGYVLPKGVIALLRADGFKTEIYKGGLSNLKNKIAEGDPVIVLIGQGISWQHYITLVGYNDEKKELYFYDSKRTTDENESIPGNRTITEEYYMELWENGLPIFNRIYISVSK